MKKMFFIIALSLLTAFAASFADGCGSGDNGWNIEASETERETESAALDNEDADAASGSDTASDYGSSGTIAVHVCGAVASPGVYEIPAGSRVCDAIEAAGGMTGAAAQSYLNLAETVADSEKIVVLTVQEAETDPYGMGSQSGTASEADASDGLVNINTADADTLTTLPGIGETRAAAIIAYRQSHGSFSSIEEITSVSGIGDATFEDIRELITV